jgi:glycosyltransferase involved in cell wall biosynthesis
MRIIVLTTSLTGGGAEFVARTWAEWLAAQGHDVRAAAITPRDDENAPAGVRLLKLKAGGHLTAARALRRLLANDPADVVLSLQNYPNLVALTAMIGMRRRPTLLISERNITAREGEPFSRGDLVKDRLAKRFYREADLVVAISHPVAAELVSAFGVPDDRLVVVPNPAGKRSEARGENPREPLSADPQHPLHLVLPMRLVPQKRAELAVGAAARLRADGVDARVVCFGRGPGLDALERAATEADVPLEVPGWSADWVADSPPNSIAVLPSYREGFGNVLVEAALGGLPSVAVSNAYGVADALVPTVSGALALAGTPDDLADAILVARDEASRPAAVSQVRDWARRFSTDSSGRALLSAIDIARTRRSRR